MSILTDFVVADISEAQRIGDSLSPSWQFEGLGEKGIDHVKLATLYALLTDQPYDTDFMSEDSLLYVASDDGPWVHRVPDDMVRRLANLAESEYSRIAEKWSQTEEFTHKHSGFTPDLARERTEAFLRRIAPLARYSLAENKILMMWTCL
jgi:hypothetical protein